VGVRARLAAGGARPLAPVRCVVVGAGPACASVRKPDATFCVRVRVAACEAEAEVSRTFALLLVSLFLSTRIYWRKGPDFFFLLGFYFIVYLRLVWSALGFQSFSVSAACARLKLGEVVIFYKSQQSYFY